VANLIDLMHLGRDRVIAAYEIDGMIVDPGPATCERALLGGLAAEPRALLLTHVHLDHAGASGVLARRFPGLLVYVHELGAPHLVDPSRLVDSARRLYGEDMERLWGEVAPVPRERIVALAGGETVQGFRVAYAPGHASHHVVYLHQASGDAYVGDVAGVRIPPHEHTVMPTPPPDIDLEAWERSLALVAEWSPARVCLTHFGPVDDVDAHLGSAAERLSLAAERARPGSRERFLAEVEAELERAVDSGAAERFRQAAPPEQLWRGLERYWRRHRERHPPVASG
jgi:glyoxylase-like metal-dependent hydrolase (beta-lactamase superfamily II)